VRQEQDGGEGSTNNQAARDIVVHNHYGVTEERFQDLAKRLEDQALELWTRNAPRLVDEAKQTYDARAMKIAVEVIKRVIAKDPELLEVFAEPRAQIALLQIQEAYGEIPDDDLGATLAKLVTELISEPAGGRRELVLRRAIGCARVLTPRMIRLLGAIYWLNHRTYARAYYLNQVIDGLEADLSTYYGEIPTSSVDLDYLGTTEAGTYYGELGPQIYQRLHTQYANLMYEPFDKADLPPVVRDSAEADSILGLLPDEHEPDGPRKLRIHPDAAAELLNNDVQTQFESAKWDDWKKELRAFIAERSIDQREFRERIASRKPGLANLLDQIESTAAQGFELSVVGMMVAQQEISGRSPEAAAHIDSYFDEAVEPA
jgi:hypothetical protein